MAEGVPDKCLLSLAEESSNKHQRNSNVLRNPSHFVEIDVGLQLV
ncbi:hypothetical protein RvY_14980 [Ramazzottius varieornatus]|uniref:Uncharacterized protein n=1 Tax=Ramazzottius varieornatus TaxID=947166 RepID=A0A1D1VY48_RAMVA|nr:hypothetical protein RvY_14980 [Ramazzottius varieornatus]